MPLFITYASYSHSGAKGMIDKPSDRSQVIKGLVEKAGGKFVALYFTTGSNDVVLVSELPDGSDAVALGMVVAASGSLSRFPDRLWHFLADRSDNLSIGHRSAKDRDRHNIG